MTRPPRSREDTFFDGGLKEKILGRGLASGAVTFAMFEVLLTQGGSLAYAQSGAFATLVFAQLWHLFDARTTSTLFTRSPFGNRLLIGAVVLSFTLSMLAIYTPAGHLIMKTASLGLVDLALCFLIASLPTLLPSALKHLTGWRFL